MNAYQVYGLGLALEALPFAIAIPVLRVYVRPSLAAARRLAWIPTLPLMCGLALAVFASFGTLETDVTRGIMLLVGALVAPVAGILIGAGAAFLLTGSSATRSPSAARAEQCKELVLWPMLGGLGISQRFSAWAPAVFVAFISLQFALGAVLLPRMTDGRNDIALIMLSVALLALAGGFGMSALMVLVDPWPFRVVSIALAVVVGILIATVRSLPGGEVPGVLWGSAVVAAFGIALGIIGRVVYRKQGIVFRLVPLARSPQEDTAE